MKSRLLPEEYIVALLMIIMAIMVFAHVLGRYVLHTSFSYTEEIVRYFFVWATFLGAGAATARRCHLSVAGSISFLSDSVKKKLRIASFVAAVLFTAILAIFGVRIVYLQYATAQTTAALGIPMWIIGLAVPVSALLVLYRLFRPAAATGLSDDSGVPSSIPDAIDTKEVR